MRKNVVAVAGLAMLGGLMVLLAAWSPKKERTPLLLTKADLAWGLGPDAFPLGVRATIVEGDPDKAGPFTMRLRLPGSYKITPHWMAREERVTVLSGSVALALGERFDTKALKTFGEGSYLVLPARSRCFLKTDKGAMLEIHGEGPWEVNYVEHSDDPRTQAASL